MTRRSWAALARVVTSVLLCAATALGQPRPRVVLLDEPATDAKSAEVSARVRGELQAAGFNLVVLPSDADVDPQLAVETAAPELQPAAVLLVRQPLHAPDDAHLVEIWVSDRALNRTFVQRLPLSEEHPQRGPRWVGVQAVELVRSRLAELALTPPPPSYEPSPPVEVPPAPPAPAKAPGAWFGGAGLGLLRGFDGVEQVWTPVLVLGARLPESVTGAAPLTLQFALRGSALGSEAELDYAGNTTEVRQSFATLDVTARFIPRSVVQPMLSVGSGVYSLETYSRAVEPLSAGSRRTWSGLGSVGAGLWTEPLDGAALVLEAKLLAAWSKTIIRMEERVVAEAGAPMGLLAAEVVAVF